LNIGSEEHSEPPHSIRGRSPPTKTHPRQSFPGIPLHPAPVRQFPLAAGKRSDSNSGEKSDVESLTTTTSAPASTQSPPSSKQISFSSLLSDFGATKV